MQTTEELAQLLARCALKERRAFESLYRVSSAQLFSLVLRIVKDRDLASEVLQESYVKIWNRAGDFRPDLAKPMTWMGAIARNQAIDLIRRSSSQPVTATEPIEEFNWIADDSAGPADLVSQGFEGRPCITVCSSWKGSSGKRCCWPISTVLTAVMN
ncbi:MAG: sigma factor [Candidatus Competibacteraceae bacterium]